MLLFIFRPVIVGLAYMAEWRFESALLFAGGVVWTVTGSMTVVSALWLLWSRGRSRRALTVGGSAIVASGALFATAAASHMMPCGGPS